MSRDTELVAVEAQIRAAIRDCVNRTSRKPFRWGGLSGYQQLETIGVILRSLPCREMDTDYLSVLSVWVDQALISNRSVASDLSQAHQWLRRIADCLHYPKKLLANKNITFIVIQLAQYKLWLINIRNFLLCLSLKS